MRKQRQDMVWRGVCVAALLAAFLAMPAQYLHPRVAEAGSKGVTDIAITDAVLQPSAERLGINLGEQEYFDAGMMLKNLVARNPGFEGGSYQSILRCMQVDVTRCADDDTGSAWPQDFWRGATYEWITGPLEGRKGSVTGSSAADHKHAGAVLQLHDDQGEAARGGEAAAYLTVRKQMPGDAAAGWWTEMQGGATLTTEMRDLSSHTMGKQALRMNAMGPGESASAMAYFDSTDGKTFLRLNGRYRLSFRAKTVNGSAVHVSLDRLSQPGVKFLERDLPLKAQWQDIHLDLNAKDAVVHTPTGDVPATGAVRLTFTAAHATVLLDDVSLVKMDGDAANTTVFRDEVVSTLRALRPGVLRFMASTTGFGNSVDNLLAPAEARERAGYSAWSTEQTDEGYGLEEFLELCAAVHADPWIVVPTAVSTEEMQELVKYLAAPAKGRVAWSARFGRIHLELGNETWNGIYKGETIEYPDDYAHRVSVVFRAARQSPGYDVKRFDLMAGGQSGWVGRNQEILQGMTNADTFTVAPYLLHDIPGSASTDAIFGALFAQPEMMDDGGVTAQNFKVAKPRDLSIYETNLHSTEGSPTQATLDAVVPSVGAGVALVSEMLQSMRMGVRSQALFTLAQWQYKRSDGLHVPLWGAVVDMGVTNRRRPAFLAAELANTAIAGAMTQTFQGGDNPTWNETSGIDGVKFQNAHELQSFAFRDGDRRSIVLINLSRAAALPVDFVGAIQPHGRVEVGQLAAGKITDSNEDAERVKIVSSVQNFGAGQRVSVPPFSVMVLRWSSK